MPKVKCSYLNVCGAGYEVRLYRFLIIAVSSTFDRLLKKYILKETRNVKNSACFRHFSLTYYFEYHTDFQDRELKSENVTFDYGFNEEYEKHIKT